MKSCYCMLAGTPACINCHNNEWSDTNYNWAIPIHKLHKQKRIIEKFDDKGNLIERITEK